MKVAIVITIIYRAPPPSLTSPAETDVANCHDSTKTIFDSGLFIRLSHASSDFEPEYHYAWTCGFHPLLR